MNGPMNEDLRRYKEPLTPAAGPYGHPYHALAVTLPIGAFSSSLVFDVISRASREPRTYAQGSAKLIETGLLGAGAAAVFGFLDYLKIPTKLQSAVGLTASTHMALNTTIVLLYAIGLARREARLKDASSTEPPVGNVELGLSLLAASLLCVSGWLGGKLTYRYGVRVADERTQSSGLEPVIA